MATASASAALRNPGRLIWAPTSLSSAPLYGGTELGLIRAVAWSSGIGSRAIRAEEYGGMPVGFIRTDGGCALVATLRGWDSDAVTRSLPGVAAGSSSGRPVMSQTLTTESQRAGAMLDDAVGVLMFIPLSPAEHPAVILYAAVPVPEEAHRVALSLDVEFDSVVAFRGVPDSSARTYAVGMIEDLSL